MESKRLSASVLVAVALLAVVGCTPSLNLTDPKLPPGFLDAGVPDVEPNAYLYVSQEQPATLPLDLLLGIGAVPGEAPSELNINGMAGWMGPDLSTFGALFRFQDVEDARLVQEQLDKRAREAVRSRRIGSDLHLIRGTGEWADALEAALSGGTTRFQEAYPKVWELMRLLPEAPPGEPVAAGFVRPTGEVINALVSRAGLDLGRFTPALGSVNVGDVAFAVYTSRPLALPTQVTPEYIREYRLGAIFVTRSSYPGFIVSFFVNNFVRRVDLEEIEVLGEKVFYREFPDAHLMAKVLGNTILFSLAPDRAMAQELMASVLRPQLE